MRGTDIWTSEGYGIQFLGFSQYLTTADAWSKGKLRISESCYIIGNNLSREFSTLVVSIRASTLTSSSFMNIRRRSTVHDLASLRLHPDGSRVQALRNESPSDDPGPSSKSVTNRLARFTSSDTQGNRIALDAGGAVLIKHRTSKKIRVSGRRRRRGKKLAEDSPEPSEGSVDRMDPRESSQPEHPPASEVHMEGDGLTALKDNRAKKKRRFYDDFSFLDAPSRSSPGVLVADGPSPSGLSASQDADMQGRYPHNKTPLPVPSSVREFTPESTSTCSFLLSRTQDLLKCIHHFASEYYAACGCLVNAPKLYRAQRKAREQVKFMRSPTEELDHYDNSYQHDGNRSNNEDFHQGENEGGDDTVMMESNRRQTKRNRSRTKKRPQRDMYRAFDGSALMAIGLAPASFRYLLQLLIANFQACCYKSTSGIW